MVSGNRSNVPRPPPSFPLWERAWYFYSCDHDGKNFQKALTAFHIIYNRECVYMCALMRVSEFMCQNVRCEDWVTKLSTVEGYLRLNRSLSDGCGRVG